MNTLASVLVGIVLTLVLALAVGFVILLVETYRTRPRAALYTRDGSPVDVDQASDERQRVLRSINVHKAVSPHVRRIK